MSLMILKKMSTKIPIFWKKCAKSFHKILQNTKYMREYDFYKMCTSGRINFFWGVFSAFMVHALTLISDAFSTLLACFAYSAKHTSSIENDDAMDQNIIYIYI